MKNVVSFSAFAFGLFLLPGMANADSPPDSSVEFARVNCEDGDVENVKPPWLNDRQFRSGKIRAQRLMKLLLKANPDAVNGNPDEMVAFTQTVAESYYKNFIAPLAKLSLSDWSICRARGADLGMKEAINEILAATAFACYEEGEIWGQFEAELYCSLASLLSPDAASNATSHYTPMTLCSANWESGCVQSFNDTISNTMTTDIDDIEIECSTFTHTPYVYFHHQYRNDACTYDLVEAEEGSI